MWPRHAYRDVVGLDLGQDGWLSEGGSHSCLAERTQDPGDGTRVRGGAGVPPPVLGLPDDPLRGLLPNAVRDGNLKRKMLFVRQWLSRDYLIIAKRDRIR